MNKSGVGDYARLPALRGAQLRREENAARRRGSVKEAWYVTG